jgi:1-acyl-sn-glycerol-3-phosphate acyltransferase
MTRVPLLALYPLWQWLVFLPLVAMVTIIGAFLAVPLALVASPRLANLYVAVPWGRLLCVGAPVRVELQGLEHIDEQQSYVFVANHQSIFDIPVIYGYSGLDLRWVMKAELRKIPFVAQGCRAIGHIFIDRGDPEQARSAINQAVARLKPGTGILFFPEGTRSRDGHLLNFKKGAFRVAIDRQMPVLPVTVSGTREVMPAGGVRIRPGRVVLRFHAPIATKGLTSEDLRSLSDRVRADIASGLDAAKSA